MQLKDLENFKIITELVEKYFSLDTKGFKLFSDILNSEEKRRSLIPEQFHPMIGEDFRFRFPLEQSVKEDLDSGWTFFRDCFYDFTDAHNLSYDNYSTNKITVQKNEVKLFKFMKKWYNEKDEDDKMKLIRRIYNKMNLYNGNLNIDRFDEVFKEAVEKVGTMKLPTTDVEVVVSFNFADWFLASTKEDWTSCLNLDSDYESCYWTGLPGLIADPNRMMIYITDGKQKNFMGIKVDRIISRTWGLLSDGDVVVPQRHYPQRFMSSYKYAELFDFDVSGDEMNDYGDFRSKTPMKEMITNYLDETVFIYQDCTQFTDNNGVYTIDGSSGMHKIVNYSSDSTFRRQFDEDTVYHYTDGLTGLVSRQSEIKEFEGDGCCCEDCGSMIDEDEGYIGSDDYMYCESCWHESFFRCDECDCTHPNDECHSEDGLNLCGDCHSDLFVYCEECDCTVKHDESYVHDNETLCSDCYHDKFQECEECGEETEVVDLEDVENKQVCRSCAIKIHEEEKEGVA